MILLRYLDSKRVVDYPLFICGTIYLVAEAVLTTLRFPHDVVVKICRATRLSLLTALLLLFVLFGVRNQTPDPCLAAEGAPLFDCHQPERNSAESSQPAETEKTHGSCSSSSDSSSETSNSSDTQQPSEEQEDIWKFIENLKVGSAHCASTSC